MDVDISVAGNLWHIFRPTDSPAVVSYRSTAHARRFLIGFAPHGRRSDHVPRPRAAAAPGRRARRARVAAGRVAGVA